MADSDKNDARHESDAPARLSEATLSGLPKDVTVPTYDRSAVTPGIVHLGVGAFHRGHQAVFIDDCLGRGETGWGIIAASLRSATTRDAIVPQDNLYTYCERNGDSETLRVIGSIMETIVAQEDPDRLLEAMCDPRVRIVTLTVTEKGYIADLAEKRLLLDHADLRHDLDDPATPRTIYGYLIPAIRRRRAEGTAPFTLLCCDNLPSNGRVLKALLCAFAEQTDPDLAEYIRRTVDCPCVMVDRIVPATTDADIAAISARLGVADAWPIVAEPYFRWVIEEFAGDRPALEKSGAEFVAKVASYEHMKLRMLNGAHTAIAAIGQIAGLDTVATVYSDPRVRRFIDAYWTEVSPTLQAEVDGEAYVSGLRQRFANPSLKHRAEQIASDASQKVPQRILEPLTELLAAGGDHRAVVMAVALWIRSCAATNELGDPIVIHDPGFHDSDAPDQAQSGPEEIIAKFLDFRRVFGPALRDNTALKNDLCQAYRQISDLGVLAALDQLTKDN